MTTQITTERLRIPRAGHLNSADMNHFIDAVIQDLANLAIQANSTETTQKQDLSLVLREMADMKQRIDQLERLKDFDELRRAWENLRILTLKSMGDFTDITFPSGSSPSLHPNINTVFGQATIPINTIQSKFYNNSIISGSIVPVSQSLSIDVTSVFDDGSGSSDHEAGYLALAEGEPKRAFNGDNQDYWIRRLEFDLDSDVSEVEVQLTVTIPDQSNTEANIIYLKPYPIGETDITALLISPDASEPTINVSGFSAVDNAKNKRYIFQPQVVSRLRIRLRQRNWFEENGRKVFEYGLQELGVQLAEFDKTYTSGASLGSNHTFISKISAPTGFNFAGLHMFHTDPDYSKESASNRHMHFQIALGSDGSDVRWDSNVNPQPQTLVQPINLGNTSSDLYIVTTLNWVETADGAQPLFQAGTSPVLESIGLQFSVAPKS